VKWFFSDRLILKLFFSGDRKMIKQQEILTNISETSPVKTKLNGFNDYQEYLGYSKSLFDLKPGEYQRLFNVLLKLQSIGQDAVQTMRLLKSTTDDDGYELIRFMIQVDGMDMGDIQTMLSS
jgi:hypothetical protein